MLVLRQINRSIRLNPKVLRHISTTKIRQDDNNKSLSDNEKQNIREKLKAIKERLLKEEKRHEEEVEPTPVKSKETASPKNEKITQPSSEKKIKTEKQESLVQQSSEKLEHKEPKLQTQFFKNLAAMETEEPAQEGFPEKDNDTLENLKKGEDLAKQRAEAKLVKSSLKSLLEESVEIVQEPEIEASSTTETDTQEKLEKQREVKKKASFKALLDDANENENKEDMEDRQLKGKIKLQELMKESEMFSSEDKTEIKVEIPHPVKKVRPVEKAAKKAESNQHIKILKSIKSVADDLGGDVHKTETELMDAVFKSTASEESERKRLLDPAKESMSSILGDLNIDSSKDKTEDPRVEIRKTLAMINQLQRQSDKDQERPEPRDYGNKSFPLFDSDPLNIFDDEYISNLKESPALEFYDKLKQKELVKMVTHSPANIYEEMIKWTKEGKLWHFPIDNEWKWSWEENVDFSEHVLLEHHLEPWCPTGGPLRHFMELVCVGLLKNPYITAEEKREHIYWFKDYFEEKRRLLEDVGAFRVDKKQIEGEKIS